jgi:hypothetical protein
MKLASSTLLGAAAVFGLREPTVALRAGSAPIALEKVLDGKNLTAVVVGAKTVSNDTIQVVFEANITSPQVPATPVAVQQKPVESNRTTVQIVYSAHEPGSLALLRDALVLLFTRGEILNVSKLELVPFGKAIEVKIDSLSTGFRYWHPELEKANISAVYRCPNGEGECESNLIHACAIKVSGNDPKVYLPFIACMSATKPGTAPEDASFSCSNSTMFMESLRTCALGPDGLSLQHDLAAVGSAVASLPTVSINGKSHPFNVSAASVKTDFTKFVCDALFAEGRMDRDRCEGKADTPIVAPFQSILPSQATAKETPKK